MKGISHHLAALVLLLALPVTAYAHSSGAFALASLAVMIFAAGLDAAIKRKLFGVLLAALEPPRARTLIGVAALEVVIMTVSLIASISVSPSSHSLAILLTGCLLYLIPAFFANYVLVRADAARIYKSILLTVIYPLSLVLLVLVLFIPLYILFDM